MAPKRRLRSNTSPTVAASSDDDTSAFQVVQRPTKSPQALAPADQESDGSDGDDERGAGDEIDLSDEIGENGALIERQPPPKRMAVAKIPMKNVASAETSPLKRKEAKSPPRKKTEKAAAPASPPPLTRNEAAALLARSPSPEKAATAAASEAAKSTPAKKAAASKSPMPKKAAVAVTKEAANLPWPKKAAARTEVAGTPPPTGPADETMNVAPSPSPEAEAPAGEETLPQEGEYDADKRFKEKSQTYWYLWQMVLTLEAEHFLSFKGAFLKMDDTKASILNTKIKKLYVKEMKQQLGWKVTEKDVTKVLVDLIE